MGRPMTETSDMKASAARLRLHGQEYMDRSIVAARTLREAFDSGAEMLTAFIAAVELASKAGLPWEPDAAAEQIDFVRALMRDAIVKVLATIPDEPQFTIDAQDVRH